MMKMMLHINQKTAISTENVKFFIIFLKCRKKNCNLDFSQVTLSKESHFVALPPISSGSSVWKAFYFTPDFYPENETACFHTHTCFCSKGYVTYHDPPLLFDLTRDPSESTPLTPDEEPAFHSVLAAMEAAVEQHRRSVEPVESQMSWWNLMWKPWLQPCCSTLAQLCQCERDGERGDD